MGWTAGVRIPAEARLFSSRNVQTASRNVQTVSVAYPASYSMGTAGDYLGVKVAEA
jgi:hypothetical protein